MERYLLIKCLRPLPDSFLSTGPAPVPPRPSPPPPHLFKSLRLPVGWSPHSGHWADFRGSWDLGRRDPLWHTPTLCPAGIWGRPTSLQGCSCLGHCPAAPGLLLCPCGRPAVSHHCPFWPLLSRAGTSWPVSVAAVGAVHPQPLHSLHTSSAPTSPRNQEAEQNVEVGKLCPQGSPWARAGVRNPARLGHTGPGPGR